jgi:hypothetical protein
MPIENYDRSDKPKKNNIRTVGYKQGLVWVGLGVSSGKLEGLKDSLRTANGILYNEIIEQ